MRGTGRRLQEKILQLAVQGRLDYSAIPRVLEGVQGKKLSGRHATAVSQGLALYENLSGPRSVRSSEVSRVGLAERVLQGSP